MPRFAWKWARPAAVLVCILLGACGSAAQGMSPAAGAAPTGLQTVQVTAEDFRFSLDAAALSSGRVTFVVTNKGSSPHDFKLSGNGTEHQIATLAQGQSATLTAELRPGTYTYVCTVPGHKLLGMEGSVTVR